MAQQVISVGTTANDGTGDPLRTAMQKANSNFTELYGAARPRARAFRDTSSYSAAVGFSKVPLNAETYDTTGAFDSTTNYRFTPLVAGYYMVVGSLMIDPGAITGSAEFGTLIYKNGSAVTLTDVRLTIPIPNQSVATSDIIFMNGSSDYLELWVYNGNSGARNVLARDTSTFLAVSLL